MKLLTFVVTVGLLASLAAAAPRKNSGLVKFHPISQTQYDKILGLTDGKPVISEGRLISSGVAKIGGFASGLAAGWIPSVIKNLTVNNNSKRKENHYPLCVISADELLKEDEDRESYGRQYSSGYYDRHGHYHPPTDDNEGDEDGNNGEDDTDGGSNSKKPIVNCIVVIKKDDYKTSTTTTTTKKPKPSWKPPTDGHPSLPPNHPPIGYPPYHHWYWPPYTQYPHPYPPYYPYPPYHPHHPNHPHHPPHPNHPNTTKKPPTPKKSVNRIIYNYEERTVYPQYNYANNYPQISYEQSYPQNMPFYVMPISNPAKQSKQIQSFQPTEETEYDSEEFQDDDDYTS